MHPATLITLLFLISCTQPPSNSTPTLSLAVSVADTLPLPRFSRPERNYPASRALAAQQRDALKAAYNDGRISLDSAGRVFTDILLQEIIPHWYGTPWAFEGHTETPGQGQIACGYFVSTTLLHTGLNLNRYRLAQQGPADEGSMLSLGDTVRVTRRGNATQALALWRKRLRNGLYFIGLEATHVGYLLKQGDGLYFIHSNYAAPFEVQLQRAEESVLMGFATFYLADITFNKQLTAYWMSGERVPLKDKGILTAQ